MNNGITVASDAIDLAAWSIDRLVVRIGVIAQSIHIDYCNLRGSVRSDKIDQPRNRLRTAENVAAVKTMQLQAEKRVRRFHRRRMAEKCLAGCGRGD
ncbi:MAG TPA: hypothetical protein VN541_18735 [Tepidisphaeraceae bacterium]|nr:hypothetical protein [Tepidisphaeraceae bacterium]